MSRMILVLSAALVLCASSGVALADQNGLVTGAVGGAVAGWIDRCPHAGLPLAMAPNRYLTREGDLILCATHGALFRPTDGKCVGGPCAGKSLWPWPVRIDGEDVVTA